MSNQAKKQGMLSFTSLDPHVHLKIMNTKAQSLQNILDKAIDNKKIFGTSFNIKLQGLLGMDVQEIWILTSSILLLVLPNYSLLQ